MKNYFFLIALFTSYISLAEKDLSSSYRIDSTRFRTNINEGESVIRFRFENLPYYDGSRGKNLPIQTQRITYAYGGENQTAVLDAQKSFEVKLKPGSYRFQLFYDDYHEEITTGDIKTQSRHKTFVTCVMVRTNYQIQVEKPVIYLYPTAPSIVAVQVEPKGDFTFTYPAYNNEWKVLAQPGGELMQNGQYYNYLFWEAEQDVQNIPFDPTSGFVVEKNKVQEFLDQKLSAFGLNSKEKADFITFWGPQLMQNEKNFVHFVMNDQCDAFGRLTITPQPDHVYRFYMVAKKLNTTETPMFKEQEIKKIDRNGFTVIEWGGSILPENYIYESL